MTKPNIVVFCTDQHPANWLGCMGNEHVKTPNIDEIASNGVIFTNAHCNTPICMASRATMFTGLPSSEHGVRTNGICLDATYPVLPQILKDNGYKTFSTGKLHLTSWEIGNFRSPELKELVPDEWPESETHWKAGLYDKIPDGYFGLDWIDLIGGHGWFSYGNHNNWLRENYPEEHQKFITREASQPSLNDFNDRFSTHFATIPNELYYNEWVKNLTIEKMDRVKDDTPFFAWVSFPDPHWPFGPPAPFNKMYDPDKIDQPLAWDDDKAKMPDFYNKKYYDDRGIFSVDGGDTVKSLEQIMETKALAYGMVSCIDHSIGGVIDHLKKIGKYENTIIIFMADHGEAMGDHRMFNKGPFHYDSVLKVPFIVSYPPKLKKGMTSAALVSLIDFMPTVLDLAGVEYPKPKIPDWQGFFADKHPMYEGRKRLVGNSLVPIMTGEKEEIQDWILIEDDDDIRNLVIRTLITKEYKLTIFMNRNDGVLFDRIDDPEERNNVWDDPFYSEEKGIMMIKMNHALMNNQERIKRRISIA